MKSTGFVRFCSGVRLSALALGCGIFTISCVSLDENSTCRSDKVCLTATEHRSFVDFVVENPQTSDITVTVEFFELENLTTSESTTVTLSLAGGSRLLLKRFGKESAGWRARHRMHWTLGSIHAQHDDNHIYRFPYSPGQSFRVSQGFQGKFSHNGETEFAVDFAMPEGTPVFAARGGKVLGVRQDSFEGGVGQEFLHKSNYVLVRHDDGTYGEYFHLQHQGARVQHGERVEVGDMIALSGNTGFSSGPHLHFMVFKAVDGKRRVSIPVRFRGMDGQSVVPATGARHVAPQFATSVARSLCRRTLLPHMVTGDWRCLPPFASTLLGSSQF